MYAILIKIGPIASTLLLPYSEKSVAIEYLKRHNMIIEEQRTYGDLIQWFCRYQ